MFAAAVPISGAGDSALAKNCINVPVGLSRSKRPEGASGGLTPDDRPYENASGTPFYTEYPDAAYDIGERVKNTPGLLDWLFDQRARK